MWQIKIRHPDLCRSKFSRPSLPWMDHSLSSGYQCKQEIWLVISTIMLESWWLQTRLRNQALAIETFQSKWQMAGQEAHAFIARTRAQSEDFVRAELTAVQRFEGSLQCQYDGQLRSHVNALQDKCRDHIGQEEDKMRKELQHALTQESSMRHDQMQQALRQLPIMKWSSFASWLHNKLRQWSVLNLSPKSGLISSALSSSSLTVLSETKMRSPSLWNRSWQTTRHDICKSLTRLFRMQNGEHSKARQCLQGHQPSLAQPL